MFLIVKTIHSILKLLNSETAPSQLAAGIAFGAIVGLTPLMSLHNLFIFLIVCLFRVNFSMFFVSLGLFSFIGWACDPLWDRLGYALLVQLKVARPLWIYLSTGPLLPYFRFNNTIVIGSFVVALLIFVPVFAASIGAVKHYRQNWREKVLNSKAIKIFKATPIYGLYEKYEKAKEVMGILK